MLQEEFCQIGEAADIVVRAALIRRLDTLMDQANGALFEGDAGAATAFLREGIDMIERWRCAHVAL